MTGFLVGLPVLLTVLGLSYWIGYRWERRRYSALKCDHMLALFHGFSVVFSVIVLSVLLVAATAAFGNWVVGLLP